MVKAKGMVRVNESFTLKDVALVEHLGYNLLSVSQLLDEELEMRFKRDTSRVLDSFDALICQIFGEFLELIFLSLLVLLIV